MLNSLKNLFDKHIGDVSADEPAGHSVALAVAALLVEIARADHEVDESERLTIARAVATVCEADVDDINRLLTEADEAVSEAVSLYDFTSVVNENFSHERKYQLLLLLWQVAYADGRVDRYEEYFVRKIGDLLHLSQREFIRAKHQAQG